MKTGERLPYETKRRAELGVLGEFPPAITPCTARADSAIGAYPRQGCDVIACGDPRDPRHVGELLDALQEARASDAVSTLATRAASAVSTYLRRVPTRSELVPEPVNVGGHRTSAMFLKIC